MDIDIKRELQELAGLIESSTVDDIQAVEKMYMILILLLHMLENFSCDLTTLLF